MKLLSCIDRNPISIRCRDYLHEMPNDVRTVDLSILYSTANPNAVDLISRCVLFGVAGSRDRMTVLYGSVFSTWILQNG
jgi:hypothetical protein